MVSAIYSLPFQYQLWNHQIISDFDLGEVALGPSNSSPQDSIYIQRAQRNAVWLRPEGPVLLEDRDENGDIWFACWKHGDDYVVGFPEYCSFLIQPSQRLIECSPLPHADKATLAHLILDHALPRLFSLLPGHLVLHACSVEVNGQVIAVLGQSGQGKSTLAGFLASKGCSVLTDDCLVLCWDEAEQEWIAQPSYESVRLWPDSVDALQIDPSGLRDFAYYSRKRRTGKDASLKFASQGSPLRGCFLLAGKRGSEQEHSGPPAVRALPVNEAFIALLAAIFRVDAADTQINSREFEVLANLTNTVPCWSLSYEREYHWLPAVQQTIIKALQAKGK